MTDYTFNHGTYGATIGGLMGAIIAARRGLSCVILEWGPNRGGMSEGGLGGAMDFIRDPHRTGATKEWYEKVIANWLADNPDWASKTPAVGQPDAYWDWNVPDYLSKNRVNFTPKQGRDATDSMLAGLNITIVRNIWIKEIQKLPTGDKFILTNGDTYTCPNWHDASYELDAARMSGVTIDYGRDASSTYGEDYAGVRVKEETENADVLDDKGNLWAYSRQFPPVVPRGTSDQMPMGYVFRMTISKHPNRLPFTPPPGYNRKDFLWFIELATRGAGYQTFQSISSYKRIGEYLYGTNGPSLQGVAWGYPETYTREARLAIWDKIQYVQRGMYWTAMTDAAMPQALRDDVAAHGLPHDQNIAVGDYYGTPGWSSQLYVRESGRMVGDNVLTGEHIRSPTDSMSLVDPINMHGYGMDSHLFRLFPTPDGGNREDGTLSDITGEGLWQVGLRHVKAPVGQAPRLVVSWGFSQSRCAICSSRIEPPFQMQGEVCGLIIAIAFEKGIKASEVTYEMLLPELKAMGAYLTGLRTGGTE